MALVTARAVAAAPDVASESAIFPRAASGWFTSAVLGASGNVSDTAIMWVDVTRDALFLLPLAWTSNGAPNGSSWDPYAPGVTSCTYASSMSSTLLYAPLSLLQRAAVRPTAPLPVAAAPAWTPWLPSVVNAPAEYLWSSTTLYIPEKQLLFSFSGHLPAGVHNDACAHVFFSSSACFMPTYRTHFLQLSSGGWVSLSPNETGIGTPSDAFGLPFAAAMGLALVYDSARDRVLALGGFLDLGRAPGAQAAGLFAYYFANNTWVNLCSSQSGAVPANDNNGAMSGSFTVYDSTADRVLSYGGLTWQGMFQSGACRVLSLSSLVWTQPLQCGWETGPWIRGDVVSAPTTLTSPARQAVMLGGRYTDFRSANLTTFVVPSMWLLDYSMLTWSSIAAHAFGPAPPLLSPRSAVYSDPSWPYGSIVLLWGGAQALNGGCYDMWPAFCGSRTGMYSYPSQFVVDTTTLYILRIDADMPTSVQQPGYALVDSLAATSAAAIALMAAMGCAYVIIALQQVISCMRRRRARVRVYDLEAVRPMLHQHGDNDTTMSSHTSVPGALAPSVSAARPGMLAHNVINTDDPFLMTVGRTLQRRNAVEEGDQSPIRGAAASSALTPQHHAGATAGEADQQPSILTAQHWATKTDSANVSGADAVAAVVSAQSAAEASHDTHEASSPVATEPSRHSGELLSTDAAPGHGDGIASTWLSFFSRAIAHAGSSPDIAWIASWLAALLLVVLSVGSCYASDGDLSAALSTTTCCFAACIIIAFFAAMYAHIQIHRIACDARRDESDAAHAEPPRRCPSRCLWFMLVGPTGNVNAFLLSVNLVPPHAVASLRRMRGWAIRRGRVEFHPASTAFDSSGSDAHCAHDVASDAHVIRVTYRLLLNRLISSLLINALLAILGLVVGFGVPPFESPGMLPLPTPTVPWAGTPTRTHRWQASRSLDSFIMDSTNSCPSPKNVLLAPMCAVVVCACSSLIAISNYARQCSALAHVTHGVGKGVQALQ